MIASSDLTAEIRHLLNPAFCGRLIASTVKAYSRPFPFSLGFLVLPLVLHRSTRKNLPRSVSTSFPAWLEQRPEVRVGFAQRAKALAPFTRSAISFDLLADILAVGEGGTLLSGPVRLGSNRQAAAPSNEVIECVRASELIGRWFWRTGDPATIYTLCGIRP